jgi:hypothetical protein
MCVVWLTLHLLYPCRKYPVYQLNRRLDGPQIWSWSPVELKKSLGPGRNLTSFTHSSIQPTAYQPHQLHHSTPFIVSSILNICVIAVKENFYKNHFLFRKKRIYISGYKNKAKQRKWLSSFQLLLYSSVCCLVTSSMPVTRQATIIFRHYFTLIGLPVQLFL